MNVKTFETFLQRIKKVPPMEFCGLATVLGVTLYIDKDTPRPFEEIFEDMLTKYTSLNRRQRRNFDKLLEVCL